MKKFEVKVKLGVRNGSVGRGNMMRTTEVTQKYGSALDKDASSNGKNLIEEANNLQINDDSVSTQNFQSK